MVASFGNNKPVNLGYGGMISTNNKEFFENNKEIFTTTVFHEKALPELMKKLESLPKRLKFQYDRAAAIKKDLNKAKIIYPEDQGINVIIKGKDKKVIEYCKKNNLEYTECPRYIRINEDAISIEVKRLEVD